jgi:hypothetical protein
MSKKETFNFYLDTKVTTWYRAEFEIEANSLDEAKQLAIQFHDEGNTGSVSWDEVDGTIENVEIGDNNGEPTEELFTENGDCIWDNTKK